MSSGWIADVRARLADGPVVRVLVIRANGSSPREAGASMIVGAQEISGTIGGGALEYQAIAEARAMFAAAEGAFLRVVRDYPLGPALDQCCGGFVSLLFERFVADDIAALEQLDVASRPAVVVHPLTSGEPLRVVADRKAGVAVAVGVLGPARAMLSGARPTEAVLIEDCAFIEPFAMPRAPLYLYGAGHVGRDVVRVLQGLPLDLVWVDTHRSRFPEIVPSHVQIVVAADPEKIAADAPADALHLVMTYSHVIDERICQAVLMSAGFLFLGLIGSKTKRARFVQRLARDCVPPAALQRLICPVGIDGITGKEPAVIAISIGAQIARELSRKRGQAVDAQISITP
jgi:xanthine dehydrogenase accessory factor